MGIYQLIFPYLPSVISLTSSGLEVLFPVSTARSRGHGAIGLSLGRTLSDTDLIPGYRSFLWTRSDFIALTLLHETRCAPLLKFWQPPFPWPAFTGCFCGFCLGRKMHLFPFRSLQNRLSELVLSGFFYHICLRKSWKLLPCSPLQVCSPEKSHGSFHIHLFANKTLLPSSLSACFSPVPDAAHHVYSCHRQPCQSDSLLQSVEAVLIPLSLRQSGLSSRSSKSV